MPKTRTITAFGGSNAALQSTIAASDPKRATLAQTLVDLFRELPSDSIGAIDFQRSKVGVWPAAGTAAVMTALAGISNTTEIVFSPVDPTKTSTLWTMAGGYTAPTAGAPEIWLTDTSASDPRIEPDIAAVVASPEDDASGLHGAIIAASQPAMSLAQLLARIEDAMAEEDQVANNAVVVVDQVAKTVTVRFGTIAAINAASAITGTVSLLAGFDGAVTDSTGTVRSFGE